MPGPIPHPNEPRLPQDPCVVGLWVQHLQADDGTWWNGGLYRVEPIDRRLVMRVDSYAGATPGIVRSVRLRDVACDGLVWSFVSDWEDGRSGIFVLRRVDDDRFDGHVHVAGRQSTFNRWRRIARAASRFEIDPDPEGPHSSRRHPDRTDVGAAPGTLVAPDRRSGRARGASP